MAIIFMGHPAFLYNKNLKSILARIGENVMNTFLGIKRIAHRGASQYAPENTLAALNLAKTMGAQWVEFDVMLTKDHKAIIFHDEVLNRTTNLRGFIKEMTFQEICQADAGAWFSPEFAGENIPTLSQWIQTCIDLQLGINLEIKETAPYAAPIAALIHDALSIWPAHLPPPLISSLTPACLKAMHKLAPQYRLGLIVDGWRHGGYIRQLTKLHAASLHIHYRALTKARVNLLHEAGFYVAAFTVNEPQLAEQLDAFGVDAIFSDDPLLAFTK